MSDIECTNVALNGGTAVVLSSGSVVLLEDGVVSLSLLERVCPRVRDVSFGAMLLEVEGLELGIGVGEGVLDEVAVGKMICEVVVVNKSTF